LLGPLGVAVVHDEQIASGLAGPVGIADVLAVLNKLNAAKLRS